MYYVYILLSKKDGSYYIGTTNHLQRRIQEHNSGGVKYTKTKNPLVLKWCCIFSSKQKAYDFEKYLKSSSGHAFMKKRLL